MDDISIEKYMMTEHKESAGELLEQFELMGVMRLIKFGQEMRKDQRSLANNSKDVFIRALIEDHIKTINNNIRKLKEASVIGLN